MPERICRSAFDYAGTRRAPGEKVDVDPVHVPMLIGAGFIERDPGDAAPAYVRRDMAADWPGNYQTKVMTAERPKRTYTRRAA